MSADWKTEFKAIYDRGLNNYRKGLKTPADMFNGADKASLAAMGCTAQELYDFIDDGERYGEPDYDTTLAVTSIRRDYFLNVMKGVPTGKLFPMSQLPAKAAAVEGIAWLPRIIAKARIKLRGEMPDELMYGCGGDRGFLEGIGMSLPDFLTLVRDSGDDDQRVIDAVKKAAGRR